MHYQLLALDVDGTLLDPVGEIRPTVRQAVLAAQAGGLKVVICTGRRFRTARVVAEELGLTGSLVVHNGALIKDFTSGATLHYSYLPSHVYHQGLALLSQVSAPLVYIDAFHEHIDILTSSLDRAHPFQQAYVQATAAHCRISGNMDTLPLHGVVMLSIMADVASLSAVRDRVETALGQHVRVNLLANSQKYQGHILEIIHPSVSKWQALQQLAVQEGIAPAQIVAVGDDWNDLEMIRHAGLGIAMGNAPDGVKAIADYVTASNAEDGLAQALDHFVLNPSRSYIAKRHLT
jgi:Cof subfamily protein (haloacid dehalogenase superfamily)